MSDIVSGNADVSAGVVSNSNQVIAPDSVNQNADAGNELVPKKELDSAVRESIKRKQQLAEAQRALDEMNKRIEQFKTQGMKDKDMWKEVAETKEKEASEWSNKYSQLQSAVVDNTKFSALKEECLKLGMIPEAVDDLGREWIDMVEIETTSSGRYQVLNGRQVAETIKMRKPYMYTRPNVANVNTGTPGVVGTMGQVNANTVLDLQKKAHKSGLAEDQRAYENALKTLARQQTVN